MEKLASFLLALAMTLILSVSAFAASGVNDNSGTITVNKTIAGQTYTIYQILQLESYNAEDGAYAYKAASGWDALPISSEPSKHTNSPAPSTNALLLPFKYFNCNFVYISSHGLCQ